MGELGVKVALAIAIACLALGGCGDEGTAPPDTVGEFCAEVGDAWCEQARACFPSDAPSQTTCVNGFVRGCCGDDGVCGDEARGIDRGDYNDCLDGFADLSCVEVDEGVVPTACLGL